MTTDKPWTLYLLYHEAARRTYIGITTDIGRRVRQHRQEISGGARFTRRVQKSWPNSPSWQLICTLSFFQNRAEATRWERLCKITSKGLQQRLEAMKSLGQGAHPKTFSDSQKKRYPVPPLVFQSF